MFSRRTLFSSGDPNFQLPQGFAATIIYLVNITARGKRCLMATTQELLIVEQGITYFSKPSTFPSTELPEVGSVILLSPSAEASFRVFCMEEYA